MPAVLTGQNGEYFPAAQQKGGDRCMVIGGSRSSYSCKAVIGGKTVKEQMLHDPCPPF